MEAIKEGCKTTAGRASTGRVKEFGQRGIVGLPKYHFSERPDKGQTRGAVVRRGCTVQFGRHRTAEEAIWWSAETMEALLDATLLLLLLLSASGQFC